jgi:hypothetical protein
MISAKGPPPTLTCHLHVVVPVKTCNEMLFPSHTGKGGGAGEPIELFSKKETIGTPLPVIEWTGKVKPEKNCDINRMTNKNLFLKNLNPIYDVADTLIALFLSTTNEINLT